MNQCDGCKVGAPKSERGIHQYSDGSLMACTAHRYIDVERLISDVLPGGYQCDPQQVADSIREWFAPL